MLKSAATIVAISGLTLFSLGLPDAKAQTYNTDYLSFEGELIVLDNPTSSSCIADGISFNSRYHVSYRFTANPGLISDALVLFPGGDNATKMRSTQSSASLNGPSTTEWTFINHYGNSANSPLASSSNLTITSGLGQPLSLGTGNIKILGSINAFNGYADCNVASVHAALVSIAK